MRKRNAKREGHVWSDPVALAAYVVQKRAETKPVVLTIVEARERLKASLAAKKAGRFADALFDA
jgi:uncharacterized small protein (DUF1192 family)